MADPYSKYLNQKIQKKPSRKLISLDDSADSHHQSIIPNVFLDSASVAENQQLQLQRKNKSKEELTVKRGRKGKAKPQIQLIDDDDIYQGEQEEERRQTALSIRQSVNLSLGHYHHHYKFPLSREIPIIVNNEDIERQKYENSTYIKEAFDNNLSTSFFLFFFFGVLTQTLFRLDYFLWLVAVILSFVLNNLYTPQYMANQYILLSLFIVAIVIDCFIEFLSIRKRRSWKDKCADTRYRVYHYQNGRAEWIQTDSTSLKPGSIYKVVPGTRIPADSLLLCSPQSIVQVSEKGLFSSLIVEPKVVLKETLIKTDEVLLPMTGVISLTLHHPELKEQNIDGRLVIEEPEKQTYNFDLDNILLRGTTNVCENELLCVVLETGIDSLLLKQSQYNHQYKEKSQNEKISEMRNMLKWAGIITSLLYLLMVGIGVLTGYIYINTIKKGYYIEDYINDINVDLLKIFLYHLTNYIMLIPILLRMICAIYWAIMTSITEGYCGQDDEELESRKSFKLKDKNCIKYLDKVNTVVTTIDSFRAKSIRLHSIKVKQIVHNFKTKSIDDEIYSTEDVDLINYFLSVSLLTLDQRPQYAPYQVQYDKSLRQKCSEVGIKCERIPSGEITINGDQFKVYELFVLPSTCNYPYRIIFYQTSKMIDESEKKKGKVLCLVRGNPEFLLDKIYGKMINLTDYSKRLHEEKGFHVEVVCKLTLPYTEYEEIRKVYEAKDTKIAQFYEGLNRYLISMEVMGLLIWDNEFEVNEFLRDEKLSEMKKIIIAPASKSITNPDFQSIHSITNLLINSLKFTVSSLSQKILHSYSPSMFPELLKEEKVLVLNGWENKLIKECLRSISADEQILAYINNDQYQWVMKEAHFAVSDEDAGYDLQKYTDGQVKSISDLVDVVKYDSKIIRIGIINLVTIQIRKSFILLTIEFINSFYTWGTGLVIIGSPLHLLLEVILLLDIFYFLNFRNQKKANHYEDIINWKFFLQQFFISILTGAFITFIPVYSMEGPATSIGTVESSSFTNILIHFVLLHCLLFYKLFLPPFVFSLYRVLFMALQIALYYIGIIVISEVDVYMFKGIIWYSFEGRIMLTAVFSTWMVLGCNWVYFMIRNIWVPRKQHEKVYEEKKEEKRIPERKGTGLELIE